jgi:hypothetical protein
MEDDDLFTLESMVQFRLRMAEAAGPGQELLQQYRQDRETQIADAPDLQAWIDALEEANLAAATDAGLWSRMASGGFIEGQRNGHRTRITRCSSSASSHQRCSMRSALGAGRGQTTPLRPSRCACAEIPSLTPSPCRQGGVIPRSSIPVKSLPDLLAICERSTIPLGSLPSSRDEGPQE